MEDLIFKYAESNQPERILPELLKSNLYGMHYRPGKEKKTSPNLNKTTLEFLFTKDNHRLSFFFGSKIVERMEKENIKALLFYSEDLDLENSDTIKDSKKILAGDKVIKIESEDETMFDVMDNIYVLFNTDKDLEKLYP